ncbi:MAG: shikimate dehydrogenase [Pseudooceanicola sp.]|nr:shikimate dehydrogenase [Pseudooceanicola sp.]
MASRISGTTRLVGLFGSPVAHSRSPVMQNTVFEAMGLDLVYLAFDAGADRAGDVARTIRLLNLRGANVTMPLKRALLPYLDALSPAARRCGAVNVVVNDDGVLTGHISDGEGFLLSLDEAGVGVAGQCMVILGAGGAGIAVAVQASIAGAKATLFNRRDGFFAQAGTLLDHPENAAISLLDMDDTDALAQAVAEADILVNATPLGMKGASEAVALPDLSLLRPGLTVCDLVYVPRETRLLREAARRGCRTVSGLGMQLWQAVPAFRLWTGREMDVDLARRVLFEGAA